MRSRTVREGSVGLLILLALALFGGLIFWLVGGLPWRRTSYNFTIQFDNANRIVAGSPVRYRGVKVGEVKNIQPQADGIIVTVTINQVDLTLPREGLMVEANQSGLVGESSIDMFLQTEKQGKPYNTASTDPISSECNSQIVVCENDQLNGEVGASIDRLIRNTAEAAEVLSDPRLVNNLIALTESAQNAADGIAQTSRELSQISEDAAKGIEETSQQLSKISTDVSQQLQLLSRTTQTTSKQLVSTAKEAELLMSNLNTVVVDNQENINTTLSEITQTSQQLNKILTSLSPSIEKLNANLESGDMQQIIDNLETLSTNAAKTSQNLQNASKALGNSENLLLLQQTLESARATFENTQKITSDMDEITGDPEVRRDLQQLIKGLSNLLSSTQQLEQQVVAVQMKKLQEQKEQKEQKDNPDDSSMAN